MDMSMPVLQLVDYVFPEIECRENPNCPRDAEQIQPPEVQVTPRVAVREDDENIYRLALDISFGGEEEQCSYIGRVKVVGIFSVSPDLGEKERHIFINGSSILYSSAREFVLSITSRGPSFPLMLPAVRFGESGKERDSAFDGQTDSE